MYAVSIGKHLEAICYWAGIRIEEVYCVGLGVVDYETVDLGGFPVESVCLNVEYEDVLGSPYRLNGSDQVAIAA